MLSQCSQLTLSIQKKENNLKQTVLISGLVLDPVLGMTKFFVVFECACTIIQMISEPKQFDAQFGANNPKLVDRIPSEFIQYGPYSGFEHLPMVHENDQEFPSHSVQQT
jgi:hypothetical protein